MTNKGTHLIFFFLVSMLMSLSSMADNPRSLSGNVYAMTNSPFDNGLLVYGRFNNGTLRYLGEVSGGGTGGGDTDTPFGPGFDPIGAQDPLVISDDGRYLYMVNVSSDEISVFYLTRGGRPILIQNIDSGGVFPASIELEKNHVFVLNIGNGGQIATFARNESGLLSPVANQTHELHLNYSGRPQGFERVLLPGDLEIDPLRRRMMMTFANGGENANYPPFPGVNTGELWSWDLSDEGFLTGEAHVLKSEALGPFAITFTEYGMALVVGAFTSSVTGYEYVGPGLELVPVTEPVYLPSQGAACWIRTTKNGFVYTTNSLSNAVSQLSFTRTGALTLVNAVALGDIGQPVDFAITDDERFMYISTSTEGAVRAVAIDEVTGELSSIGSYGGLPIYSQDGYAPAGLVVR